MEIQLQKRPKNVKIICGFPGVGLVGAIAVEFLIDHLETEQIGKFYSKELPAMMAIHNGKLIDPFGINYCRKNNLVLIRGLTMPLGFENKLGDAIIELAKILDAKDLILVEGINTTLKSRDANTFYLTTSEQKKKEFEKLGLEWLEEGITVGVVASLLSKKPDASFIFAETHSQLPDAKAAAEIIKRLDQYLGLKVDYKPLIKKAILFEKKLKSLLADALKTKMRAIGGEGKKKLSTDYVG